MIKIGKKSKDHLEPGYVYVPYITTYDVVASPGFHSASMTSRYKNPKVEKIKKILEKIEDSNFTSS
jgi:hypothetical protein